MDVGVELLVLGAGIDALKAVLLERVDQDSVGHLEAIVQGKQVLVLLNQLFLRNSRQSAVKIVDRLDQIAGEALDSKVLGSLDFALGALLQVVEFSD